VTLESLEFRWGDIYLVCYARDKWVALRRDHLRFLTADTLAGLERAIESDHRDHPLPRDFGPAGAADYLSVPDDDLPDEDLPDDASRFVLAALRHAFPLWTITYSAQMHAWIAWTRTKTLCENSPVLLCAALLMLQCGQPPGWPGPVPRGRPGGKS
jgi:hypothetical protein